MSSLLDKYIYQNTLGRGEGLLTETPTSETPKPQVPNPKLQTLNIQNYDRWTRIPENPAPYPDPDHSIPTRKERENIYGTYDVGPST